MQLLEGLEVSEIFKSNLEYSGRIDAEYYKPTFIKFENLIKSKGGKLLSDNANFLIGPFGSAFTVDNYVEERIYRYIRGKDVKPLKLMDNDNVYMSKEHYEGLSKYALKENDVMVSVVGTIGNAAIIQKENLPAVFSCKNTVIRTNDLNPKYLLAYLNCRYGRELLQRKERGAIQKGLNLDDLKNLDFFDASLNLQNIIEEVFNKSSYKINESQQKYTQAENLLLETLGLQDFQPSTDAVNVKSLKESFLSSGRLDAEYYQPKYDTIESKLDKLNTFKIKEVFTILSSPSPSKYQETGIKVIKTKNVRIPNIEIDNITDHTEQANLLIKKDDLLFASMGVGSLGRVSYIDKEVPNCTIDGTIKLFRIKEKVKNQNIEIPTLLFLTSSIGQELIYKYVIGSTGIISISKENIENLLIPEIDSKSAKRLSDLVLESQQLKTESEKLLETAKLAVEIAIEESEEKAIIFINENS
ncbi:restriction endonuclease subunit S [Elizabethkingia anophelis]|uniref:restriction endonuclease subunit S n=1 Tax=Elizabethkingia anophelis TaxID=1117645 RepID=UPI003461863F